MLDASRSSRTRAGAHPLAYSARRQPSIAFGSMPAKASVGTVFFSSSDALSWLITSSLAGQSAYRPSTSVSTTSISASRATAMAAAAVVSR